MAPIVLVDGFYLLIEFLYNLPNALIFSPSPVLQYVISEDKNLTPEPKVFLIKRYSSYNPPSHWFQFYDALNRSPIDRYH